MHDSAHLKPHAHRRRELPRHRRRHWCCSLTKTPLSPENAAHFLRSHSSSSCHKKIEIAFPQTQAQQHHKPPLARRILSPGRVSPISDHPVVSQGTARGDAAPKSFLPAADSEIGGGDESNLGVFDVRLNLKGKNGESLVLELGSDVLTANSSFFADLIADYRRNRSGLCRIEVLEVDNLNVFRATVELMFEEDIQHRLLKIGVFRAIGILEVSAGIKFGRCVSSCLKYLEAVPWTEEEEEKLRELFSKLDMNDDSTRDISDRFCSLNSVDFQRTLTKQLICSITTCTDNNARNEVKSLVKGLLCKSSVYEKECPDLSRDDIFSVCESCLGYLCSLLEEASSANAASVLKTKENNKPLLERISKQVDNLNWLLDILLDNEMAKEFVDLWANQNDLLKMHENASPMVRYELSRVTAMLFLAVGTRKVHCPSESRLRLLHAWFKPMLLDFGWLQRCRKGLDMKALEEAMGQALLTLPLKEQYGMFMDWFHCFSKQGTECPNLSKAFQIWWRRSFLRGLEAFAIESPGEMNAISNVVQ